MKGNAIKVLGVAAIAFGFYAMGVYSNIFNPPVNGFIAPKVEAGQCWLYESTGTIDRIESVNGLEVTYRSYFPGFHSWSGVRVNDVKFVLLKAHQVSCDEMLPGTE